MLAPRRCVFFFFGTALTLRAHTFLSFIFRSVSLLQHAIASSLFSGGAAGTVASCLTNPLDVVKTQLQSSSVVVGDLASGRGHPLAVARKILEQDGVSGFFRGLPPTLFGIIPSRSAYFYAYQRIKHGLGPVFPEGSPPNAIIAGLLAGIVGNTLTNPIWMVRTRMQLHVDAAAGQRMYRGYGDVIATIFREEGVKGFYKGIQASYWGCTEGAVQFLIYEQLKTRLLRRENARRARHGMGATEELSNWTYFWAAAVAKMCASIGTYPHEVARTRMREQARMGVFKYNGMWQTIRLIAQEEGRQGLYGGMGVHLMKVVPNSALMFLTYEVVRRWLSEFTVVDA
jgi:solute carrier family 25, member 33/36